MDERITIEPGKRSGQPCIRGLRITVWDVLGWLATGKSEEQILAILSSNRRISARFLTMRRASGGVSRCEASAR
jgi:hypothetical protein